MVKFRSQCASRISQFSLVDKCLQPSMLANQKCSRENSHYHLTLLNSIESQPNSKSKLGSDWCKISYPLLFSFLDSHWSTNVYNRSRWPIRGVPAKSYRARTAERDKKVDGRAEERKAVGGGEIAFSRFFLVLYRQTGIGNHGGGMHNR